MKSRCSEGSISEELSRQREPSGLQRIQEELVESHRACGSRAVNGLRDVRRQSPDNASVLTMALGFREWPCTQHVRAQHRATPERPG